MADLNFTVQQSGGDYTSLEAAVNANEQDLVSNTDTITFSIEGSWTVDDTTLARIENYTSNATYFVTVTADADSFHEGYEKTNRYRLVPTGARALLMACDFAVVEKIAVDATDTDGVTAVLIYNPSDQAHLRRCLVNGTLDVGVQGAGDECYIYNNICYANGPTPDRNIRINDANADAYVYNNTCADSISIGIYAQAGNCTAKNNVVTNASNYNYYGSYFDAASDYNMSDDTTDTGGTNDETSQTFTFVAAGSDNFHLDDADAGAQDLGTDLSGDGTLPISIDIDGDSRSDWDAGADEITGGATTETSTKTATGHVKVAGLTATKTVTGHVKSTGLTSTKTATGAVANVETSTKTATGYCQNVGVATETSTIPATGHVKTAGLTSVKTATGHVANVETSTKAALGHVLSVETAEKTATGHVGRTGETSTKTTMGAVANVETDSKTALGHVLNVQTATKTAMGYVTGGAELNTVVASAVSKVYAVLNGDSLDGTGGIVEEAIDKTFTLLDGNL